MYRLYTLFEGLRLRSECHREYMFCGLDPARASARNSRYTLLLLSRCSLAVLRCLWPYEGDNEQRTTTNGQRPTDNDQRPTDNDMNDNTYEVFSPEHGAHIKAWTRGVPVEDAAKQQLLNIATLPFIYRSLAVMPDVHLGKGAPVASVIPTTKAIIPAAAGLDCACGMMA